MRRHDLRIPVFIEIRFNHNDPRFAPARLYGSLVGANNCTDQGKRLKRADKMGGMGEEWEI
jgi:hypothetical protein